MPCIPEARQRDQSLTGPKSDLKDSLAALQPILQTNIGVRDSSKQQAGRRNR
jgi:hypothetical protein